MAIINPPIYEFTGIDFNSSYFNSANTNGLTQAQANKLYLQKTVQDSASAIETFNSGILSDSIQSITGTSSIFSTTMSSLSIGSLASAISWGGSSTTTTFNGPILSTNATYLAIGDNSSNIPSTSWIQSFWVLVKGQANTWSQANTFSNSVLTPTITYAGTMNIGNTSTTLNMGTQASRTAGIHIGDGNSASGVVHINNGTNVSTTNAVRILDGTGSTGSVNIGISGTTTNLNGTTNINSLINTGTITLGSLPSTSSQLGGSVSMINNGVTSLAATTTTNLYSFILPAGIWVVYGGATSATVASASYILLSFTSTSATVNVNLQSQVMTSTSLNLANALMCPIYNATSTTWYLVGRAGVITSISNLNCLAYRIG